MLIELAEKYFFDGNYNCAETIIHVANEAYGFGLDENSMRLVSGFGAGIQCGNMCGAILAAVSVVSMKYVETKAHESDQIKPVTNMLIKNFKEAFNGSLLCKDIKPVYFDKERRCIKTIAVACDVLERTLADYEAGKIQA